MSFMLSAGDAPLPASSGSYKQAQAGGQARIKTLEDSSEDGESCPRASQSQTVLIAILIISKVIFRLKPYLGISPTPVSSHALCFSQP